MNDIEILNKRIKDFDFTKLSIEDCDLFKDLANSKLVLHIISEGMPIFRCRRHNEFSVPFFFEKDIIKSNKKHEILIIKVNAKNQNIHQ